MGVRDFDSYRVTNPAAGNVYFDTAGNAITLTNQPKIDGGAATMSSGSRVPDNLNAVVIFRTEREIYGSQLTPDLAGTAQGTRAIAGRTFAGQEAGRYIMRRGGANANFIAGVADTTLRSGASDFGLRRTIKRREIVRGPLTATAIRAGQWHTFSGIWVSGTLVHTLGGLDNAGNPASSTDGLGDVAGNTTGGTDHAAIPSGSKPGELVYYWGSGDLPFQDDYKPRTTF